MDILELKAAYNLGFYHRSIFSGATLILGDFGLSESHTEILKGLSPLKGAIRRLMEDDKSNKLLKKLDKVYDYIVKLKQGNIKDHGHGEAIFNTIKDLCIEVEQAISEYRDANLNDRAFFLFESGRLLSAWFDLYEPPSQLSKEALESLISNLKGAKLLKAAKKARKIHNKITKDIWSHSEVWSLHNEIQRQLGHEAIQQSYDEGQESVNKNHMTQLPNLEQFDKDSVHLFENPDMPVSLAFVDLDDLKKLNLDIGHDAADEVIQQLALILENSLEYRAKVYHRSGDEFLLVFQNTASEEAKITLERVGLIIKNHQFDTSVKKVNVTMSAGISTIPEHADNIKNLKKYANEAMKTAKSEGKSRVKIFDGHK